MYMIVHMLQQNDQLKTVSLEVQNVHVIAELNVLSLTSQVTTLVNHPKKKGSKLGKSKNAHKLAQDIEDATARLIKTGEDIAQEFPEIKDEMLAACKDCRDAGKEVSSLSSLLFPALNTF